ncbi:MAG: GNAT family N-acetyltransferase [Gammaproteobacteria bacterium]
MQIRPSTNADKESIRQLHLDAFDETEAESVAQLALDLLADKSAEPLLSLVAIEQDRIIGHVLFTSIKIDNQNINGYIMAPLAVAPADHGKGVGSQLIKEGLLILRSRGTKVVLVLGDPNYYSRFGFKAGHKLKPPHDIAYPEAWMALELQDSYLETLSGTVTCADSLNAKQHW